MRIIVIASLNNAEKSLFVDSLKAMGHEVYNFSWNFNDAYTPEWPVFGRRKMNDKMETFVMDRARDFDGKIDFVFCYLSVRMIEEGRITKLRNRLPGVPFVNFSWDDKLKFAWFAPIAPEFDLCWTTEPEAEEWYNSAGAKGLYLAPGANPAVFHQIESSVKYNDVTFIGLSYGNRPAVIQDIRDKGIDIKAFGEGFGGKIPQKDMVRLYNESKINLGFARILDTEYFNVKGRDFEIPMSGGFYLTEHHEGLRNHYELGKEIVTYTDTNDCIQKIKYYLENEEERKEIAKAGWLRANRDHTIFLRFKKLFRQLGIEEVQNA